MKRNKDVILQSYPKLFLMKKLHLIYLCCVLALPLFAQKNAKETLAQPDDEIIEETMEIQGQIVKVMIVGGDTLIVADLHDVSVASLRKFKDNDEYRYYLRMRYHATKVYPYGVEAIKLFREVEYWSQDKNKRQRKKHIKRLHKEMKTKFEDPLKNLTRTQGRILVEMIEREIDTPVYYIIKEMRGPVRAAWWQNIGKLWGYNLKEGYDPEKDPILESILSTLAIEHEVD